MRKLLENKIFINICKIIICGIGLSGICYSFYYTQEQMNKQTQYKSELKECKKETSTQDKQLEELEKQLKDKDNEITNLKSQIEEKDNEIKELKN